MFALHTIQILGRFRPRLRAWGLGALGQGVPQRCTCRMAWESAERSDAPAYALSPGRMSATLKPLEAAEFRDAKDSQCVSGYHSFEQSGTLELWTPKLFCAM